MKNYKRLTRQEVSISTAVNYEGISGDSLNGKHLYSYKITIRNNSLRRIKLLSRKWIIIDSFGGSRTIEGEGVVGQQPEIDSGGFFQYSSWCPIKGFIGSMSGEYFLIDLDTSEDLIVEIPEFALTVPAVLN